MVRIRFPESCELAISRPLLGQLLDIAVAEQPGGLGDELLAHHAGDAGYGRKARRQAIGARQRAIEIAAGRVDKSAPASINKSSMEIRKSLMRS